MRLRRRLPILLAALASCLLLALPTRAASRAPSPVASQLDRAPGPRPTAIDDPVPGTRRVPAAWHIGPFEVTRVVDGDTLHVRRGERTERLRLLSVDTEEVLRGSPARTGTVFGEETMLWARELIEAHADADGIARVSLLIPDGEERHDVFGRLLCHVLLSDGVDLNLLLVHQGRSPYYTKYGYSRVDHEAFVAAEARARELGLGLWDPATNRPSTPGTPAARRPYERLLPWWDARARAIEGFRARRAELPLEHVSAEDPEALASSVAAGIEEVTVFGEIHRLFEEDDGSRTVLFRSSDRSRALRVRIPPRARAAHEELDLQDRRRDYRQNFLYVRGRLRDTERGFELRSSSPAQWQLAGPEPRLPAEEQDPAARH